MARYCALGMETKLKFVGAGERAEFVGLHCLMTNTGVSRSWGPDLLHTLTKLCVTLGREDYLSIAVSRYCSFSLMWALVSEEVAAMFLRLPTGCANQCTRHNISRTRIHEFDDAYLWQMQDELSADAIEGSRYANVNVSGVLNATRSRLMNATPLTQDEQIVAFTNSLELPVTSEFGEDFRGLGFRV